MRLIFATIATLAVIAVGVLFATTLEDKARQPQGASVNPVSVNPAQSVANPSANLPTNQAQGTAQSVNPNSINPNANPQGVANPPANQNANPQGVVGNPILEGLNLPQEQGISPTQQEKPRPSDPDERLKEDIVNFEREKYFPNANNVDDPFIYVYEQSEDEVAQISKLEQAVLTLKSIMIAPDSKSHRIKRYKAHINNQWVEECKVKGKECDIVEGWEVIKITKRGVKLRVTRYNLNRELELASGKVSIKNKKETNHK